MPNDFVLTLSIHVIPAVSQRGYSYSNNTERTKNNETFLKDSVAVVYGLKGQ